MTWISRCHAQKARIENNQRVATKGSASESSGGSGPKYPQSFLRVSDSRTESQDKPPQNFFGGGTPSARVRLQRASMEDGMFNSEKDVATVNSLIATTIDSINGYRESADAVDSQRFRDLFNGLAEDRQQVLPKLQAQVAKLGGNPEDDGTALAAAHRGFVDLKAAITGRDDKAIIDEVERGEDHIKHKYESALREEDLSPETREIINAAYESVRRGHDQVRDLKHALEGTR
jgi:uncharacterized protein (TIGR02284 family)